CRIRCAPGRFDCLLIGRHEMAKIVEGLLKPLELATAVLLAGERILPLSLHNVSAAHDAAQAVRERHNEGQPSNKADICGCFARTEEPKPHGYRIKNEGAEADRA